MGESQHGGARSCGLSLVKLYLLVDGEGSTECDSQDRAALVSLTEHFATSSNVSAPWVADLVVVDAILLTVHIPPTCKINKGVVQLVTEVDRSLTLIVVCRGHSMLGLGSRSCSLNTYFLVRSSALPKTVRSTVHA